MAIPSTPDRSLKYNLRGGLVKLMIAGWLFAVYSDNVASAEYAQVLENPLIFNSEGTFDVDSPTEGSFVGII